MALRKYADLAHDDDQMYDLSKGMGKDYDPPAYPGGLKFSIAQADLERAGEGMGEMGATMHFSAMAECTSVFRHVDDGCRCELQILLFAGEDGKFFEPTMPACICLCGPEFEKMDLDDDCERGDLIHLQGNARLESSSSTEWGGDMVTFQITEMTFAEDESTEGEG